MATRTAEGEGHFLRPAPPVPPRVRHRQRPRFDCMPPEEQPVAAAAAAQLALAAVTSLSGLAADSGAQALAAVCERHGLDAEVRVL